VRRRPTPGGAKPPSLPSPPTPLPPPPPSSPRPRPFVLPLLPPSSPRLRPFASPCPPPLLPPLPPGHCQHARTNCQPQIHAADEVPTPLPRPPPLLPRSKAAEQARQQLVAATEQEAASEVKARELRGRVGALKAESQSRVGGAGSDMTFMFARPSATR
jgi:hypothetical protein